MMKTKRVLVTGGAGFIGSHACKELSLHGYEPVTYDNLSTGNVKAVRWGPLVEGDLLNGELLENTLRGFRPIAVLHFAASAYVRESLENPAKYYRNNVGGMLSLLSAVVRCGVKPVIFSSSCATYGVVPSLPIVEGNIQQPINPYGQTKLSGEHILRDYSAAYGLRCAILRYFNACGADPGGEIGEWHAPETHIIPLALRAAAGTDPVFQVFGTDYDTPDGTCIRDYIHVTDLARAHVLALEHLLDGGEGFAVNLGSGTGHSVHEILEAIERSTGRPVPHVTLGRRLGDPPALYASSAAARDLLGFSTEYSELETIVATAAPFFGLSASS